jgi:hypothetical protein
LLKGFHLGNEVQANHIKLTLTLQIYILKNQWCYVSYIYNKEVMNVFFEQYLLSLLNTYCNI